MTWRIGRFGGAGDTGEEVFLGTICNTRVHGWKIVDKFGVAFLNTVVGLGHLFGSRGRDVEAAGNTGDVLVGAFLNAA